MNIQQKIYRVEKLHTLIQQRKTGSPKELAERLGISRASLYVLIDKMNALNMPVAYSRKHETFYYEKEVEMKLSFSVSVIENPLELRKINAGNLTSFLPSDFSDRGNLSLSPYLAEYKESYHRL